MSSSLEVLTQWRFSATGPEVSEILLDFCTYPNWWPSVYLDAIATPAGTVVKTKGWLPLTSRWTLRLSEDRGPHGFTIIAQGDLSGTGILTIDEIGGSAIVTCDWNVTLTKGTLKILRTPFKRILRANCHWALKQGEDSLRLEIIRRRAAAEKLTLHVPDAPLPTWPHRTAYAQASLLRTDR
jgi:hypothetical protein